jgi:hypothetical protein
MKATVGKCRQYYCEEIVLDGLATSSYQADALADGLITCGVNNLKKLSLTSVTSSDPDWAISALVSGF